MAKVFTIGHSNRKWSDFVSTLKDNHIDVVVDVRRYPGSRKCPQFNKEQIYKLVARRNESTSIKTASSPLYVSSFHGSKQARIL
jgi:uncharacterized protein (DUF488 family)